MRKRLDKGRKELTDKELQQLIDASDIDPCFKPEFCKLFWENKKLIQAK